MKFFRVRLPKSKMERNSRVSEPEPNDQTRADRPDPNQIENKGFLMHSWKAVSSSSSPRRRPTCRPMCAAMAIATRQEKPGTQASQAMNIIATNIDMAQEDEGPICQDTGMPTFFVHTPVGVNQIAIAKAIRSATAEHATRQIAAQFGPFAYGQNSGDNLGAETPDSLRAGGARRDRSETAVEGRGLREQRTRNTHCLARLNILAAQTALPKVSANAFSMRFGRRKGKAALQAPLEFA